MPWLSDRILPSPALSMRDMVLSMEVWCGFWRFIQNQLERISAGGGSIALINWDIAMVASSLQCRYNECDGVLNHQPSDCLLNRLFRRRSKKTPKLRVTCLCAGNSPVTGEFPTEMASNAEKISIWWRHHVSVERHLVLVTSIITYRCNRF